MAVQSTLRSHDRFSRLFDHFYTLLRERMDQWRRRSRLSKQTATLLATIALAFTIIAGGYGGLRMFRRRKRELDEGRRLLRKNSSQTLKDGSRVIYVPYKDRTKKVVIYATKWTTFEAHRRLFLAPPYRSENEAVPGIPPADVKPGLNLAFVHQFRSLMSIMVPRWRCKESGLLASHAAVLLCRTYMSLVIADLDGRIARDLIARDGKSFAKGVALWLCYGGLASWINSQIKYLQAKLAIAFRTRLSRYIHDLYLNPSLAYYKLHNLDGGIGQHADHFITQDLANFCDASASLYSSIGKPLVDMFFFNYQIYRTLGSFGLGGLLSCYVGTTILMRKLSPAFGKIKAYEARKEGEYRGLHARLIANSEEVAFYAGGPTEHALLNKAFKELVRALEACYTARIQYHLLDDFVLKYGWSVLGYLFASLPVFLPSVRQTIAATPKKQKHDQSSSRMREFITLKHVMMSLADAGSRLMTSMKDLSELAGYTSRVFALISTLHRVNANAYPRPLTSYPELYSLADVEGTLAKGFDGVRLDSVPIVAPSLYPMGGEELINDLSFRVTSGEHILITGPNGAGKSSVARIVAGLWPTFRGIASRPRTTGQDGIMFVPQRPYLSTGTLRDQVIYPHTEMNMRQAQRSDAELQTILDMTRLGYIPHREGGWDTKKVWKDVFSGGEKQRVGLARLLYHEPRYAFIDEGTSAVSSDVEGLLYETCKERGITLITISTRASLKRYHEYTLTLGLGADASGYEFLKIGTSNEKESVEKEILELREQLQQVEGWRARRREIEEELGRVFTVGGDESVDVSVDRGSGDELTAAE